MTLPGPAFQEYTGSCHENVLARWSDCIGQDRDSCHLVILSTILQRFTTNETKLFIANGRCHFVLRTVSFRQS